VSVGAPDGEVPAGPPTAGLGAVVGPVAAWAVAAVCGGLLAEIVVARVASPGTFRWVWPGTVGAAFLPISLVVHARRLGGRRVTGGVAALTLLAVVAVSAVAAGARMATTEQGLLPALVDTGGWAELELTVRGEPRPIATGWQVVVDVDGVDGVATRERVALTLDGDPPALGTRWVARASARPLPDGGYGRWLARQHAVAVIDPDTWEPVGGAGPLARASEHVRATVRAGATRHLDERVGGLLVGFVIGDTRLLPEADREAMRATGLTHLTAVSGSHVAIVIGGVLAAASILRAPAWGRWAAVGSVVPWFAFVTRFEPSVLRAGTMALLLLGTTIRGVVREPRHAVAVAVLLLVLVDPRLAGSLGLLLSATATAGVLVLAPVVRQRLPRRFPRRLAELLSITVGAQLAVVPLLLTTFGEVGLSSVPANLVAVPAGAVAATLGFAGALVSLVSLEAGAWVFAAAGWPARIVLAAANGFAGVGGVVELTRPATVAGLLAAGAWVLGGRGTRRARAAATLTVLAVVLTGVQPLLGRLPVSVASVTAIDVGQGDAFLLETPGARILVDAGEGEAAARWLRRHGRTSLDLVVVTHPHLDHIGGVPEVLRSTEVHAVWASPLPTELPEAAEVWAEAAARSIPVRAPAAGDVARVGDVVLEVLHPPPGRPYRHTRSELNESSTVVRAHVDGGGRVLFTGDVEATAQGDLLAASADRLRTEVLTVPHHGSATTDPAFLAATGAHVGLISAGAGNRHGHPHEAILATLEALGIEVRRTDLEGSVRVAVPTPVQAAGSSAAPDVFGGRVPAAPVDPGERAAAVGRTSSLPGHDPTAAARRRRRPAAPARAGPPGRRVARAGRRAHRRSLRRHGARPPPRAADRVALRWPGLRGGARRGGRLGRPQGRARGLRSRTFDGGGARARRTRARQGAEARQAGEGARDARGREASRRLGRPWVGSAGRGGVPSPRSQGGRHRDRGGADPRRHRPSGHRVAGRVGVRRAPRGHDADRRARRCRRHRPRTGVRVRGRRRRRRA
jgi:competence protein ComEC